MPLRIIYWNVETGKLLINERLDTARDLAAMYWTDRLQLRVVPVKPYPAGGRTTQLQAFDVSDHSLQMTIAKRSDLAKLATQLTWVADEDNNWYEAVLVLDTAQMTAAFSGITSLDAILEMELIGDGEPYTVQSNITLKKKANHPGTLNPDSYEPASALVANLALLFDDSDTTEWEIVGNSIKSNVRRKALGRIGAGPDGIFVEETVPAPDDFLPALRLESPFLEGGTVTEAENDTDSEAVVVGGTAGVMYEMILQILGRVELRSYSGGSTIGRFYKGATAPGGARNVWKLRISSPEQTYWLNYDVADDGTAVLNYLTPPLLIEGGATVTLSYDTMDGEQLSVGGMPPLVEDPEGTGVPFIEILQSGVLTPGESAGDETVYEALTIAATGTTTQEIAYPHRIKSLKLTVTDEVSSSPAAYTNNVVLSLGEDLHDGDIYHVTLVMPASILPTINFRNATVGGTILIAIAGEIAAKTYDLRFVYTGSAWILAGYYLNGAGPVDFYRAYRTNGVQPTAQGANSIAIGADSDAVASTSMVLGRGLVTHMDSELARGSFLATKGKNKFMSIALGKDSTNATPAALATGILGGVLTLEAETTCTFWGYVQAWCESTGQRATYFVEGMAHRTGSTTTLDWSSVTVKHEDDVDWDINVAVSDSPDPGQLQIIETGEAAKLIRWRMDFQAIYQKAA
jgi:hypothetical protein